MLKGSIPAANGGLEEERRAFERQRAKLLRRYAGEYVAIFEGRVADHGKDDELLAARMFQKVGDAPFYIGRVERVPSVCEVPSPELTSEPCRLGRESRVVQSRQDFECSQPGSWSEGFGRLLRGSRRG
ncbi:MAG TPA: DUF5678 domain-containing protein [Terriglobales bacterium]